MFSQRSLFSWLTEELHSVFPEGQHLQCVGAEAFFQRNHLGFGGAVADCYLFLCKGVNGHEGIWADYTAEVAAGAFARGQFVCEACVAVGQYGAVFYSVAYKSFEPMV